MGNIYLGPSRLNSIGSFCIALSLCSAFILVSTIMYCHSFRTRRRVSSSSGALSWQNDAPHDMTHWNILDDEMSRAWVSSTLPFYTRGNGALHQSPAPYEDTSVFRRHPVSSELIALNHLRRSLQTVFDPAIGFETEGREWELMTEHWNLSILVIITHPHTDGYRHLPDSCSGHE